MRAVRKWSRTPRRMPSNADGSVLRRRLFIVKRQRRLKVEDKNRKYSLAFSHPQVSLTQSSLRLLGMGQHAVYEYPVLNVVSSAP